MAKFHSLKISDIRKETANCVSIAFDIPQDIQSNFDYKAGQYITLKLNVNGEEIRRSYSLSSSPVADSDFRIAVKKVDDGRASTLLNESVDIGTTIEVMEPAGNFTTNIVEGNNTHYVAFAAGSGITPVISIIKSILATDSTSRFTLLYGNKTSGSIIYKDELDSLSEKYKEKLKVVNILTQEDTGNESTNGRVTKEKAQELLTQYVDMSDPTEFFLCGPETMINNCSELLAGKGIAKESIHFELFTTPIAAESEATKSSVTDFNGVSEVTVRIDGEEITFKLNGSGDAVLDAAIDAGVDAPFSCKGAVCCTCKAKIVEGTVEMEMNYALSDGEVEEGFILTCQSHPTSEKLVIDYDVI